MKTLDVLEAFKAEAEAAQLSLAHLAPWTTWKLFKHFIQHELEDAYETAAFQFARFDDDPEDPYLAVFYVWQFTERNPSEEGEDEFLGRMVVEFRYAAEPRLLLPDTETWSMDFHSAAEWAAVVEGLPQFQEAIGHEPLSTQVHFDQES